ncbi:MAG: polyprenyl synthetase family protein [Actinomycetota bacterium]
MPPVVRPSAAFPDALLAAAEAVERRIADLLGTEVERWSTVDPLLAEPLGALREFVANGGKRLRPAFVHAAYTGAGGDALDPIAVDGAAAVELVHTFALVHEDVMDGSKTRRGAAALHQRFGADHSNAGWRGEARRFGEGLAILVGDFAIVYADTLMAAAGPEARAIYDELRIELCVGQSLDLMATARGRIDGGVARRIAVYKSGKYTVERPLHLGAALAGRLPELATALSAIGLPLGRAFQLRDDVLGAFGEHSALGKPVGDDLREGKATPLLALAYERTDAAGRAVLDRVGAPDLGKDDIACIGKVINASGALSAIEAEIEILVEEARTAVDAAPLSAPARAALHDLAGYVAWRDR